MYVPRLQAANKASWYGKRDQEVETICGPNLNLRPNLCIDLSTFTLCRMLLIQNIIRVIFKYVYEAGSLITSKIYPHLTIFIMSQKLWFYILLLDEDGNYAEITDETHSVDDYDEDENEEYDNYQSSSWSSMYSYSSPVLEARWMQTEYLRLISDYYLGVFSAELYIQFDNINIISVIFGIFGISFRGDNKHLPVFPCCGIRISDKDVVYTLATVLQKVFSPFQCLNYMCLVQFHS